VTVETSRLKISLLLWNLKICYSFESSPLLVPIPVPPISWGRFLHQKLVVAPLLGSFSAFLRSTSCDTVTIYFFVSTLFICFQFPNIRS